MEGEINGDGTVNLVLRAYFDFPGGRRTGGWYIALIKNCFVGLWLAMWYKVFSTRCVV